MNARSYLDHVAHSPLRPAARDAMDEIEPDTLGNPGSPHREGQRARAVLDQARVKVAHLLDVPPRSVIFTSGGTEALRIAWVGAARAAPTARRTLIRSALAHPAVVAPIEDLVEGGSACLEAPASSGGTVSSSSFIRLCGAETAVAGLAAVNHEMGTQQPIEAVGAALHELGIPLVCDATLAPGRLPVAPLVAAAPLCAFSGHLFGGPVGIGVLTVAPGTPLRSPSRSGVSEERLRGGMPNVRSAVGFAIALEAAIAEQAENTQRFVMFEAKLRALLADTRGWRVVGDADVRAPGVMCLAFDDIEGEALMMNLDLAGVAVGTGSSCALGGSDLSPGLLAIGMSRREAACTIRISFGWNTQLGDVKGATQQIRATLDALRTNAEK